MIWELAQDNPIIDFTLFKDANFRTANVMMFFVGVVLLGSTVLLPLMIQSAFHYTSTQAGMVMTPGSLAMICAMPLMAIFAPKLDPRFLIASGIAICAYSLYMLSEVTLETTYSTFMWIRVINHCPCLLIFMPVNGIAYLTVPGHKIGQATSLINFSRNIGSAVGISFVVLLLQRYGQAHQSTLAAHTDPLSPIYQQHVNGLAAGMMDHGATAKDALFQAQNIVYGQIQIQANFLAYLDDFRILAIVLLPASFPFILFIKKPPKNVKIPEGAH